MPGRNDLCPCGSTYEDGKRKKYKHCCMLKESENNSLMGGDFIDKDGKKRLATWKVFVMLVVGISLCTAMLAYFDMERIAGLVFGSGMILTVIYSAFRSPPSPRRE